MSRHHKAIWVVNWYYLGTILTCTSFHNFTWESQKVSTKFHSICTEAIGYCGRTSPKVVRIMHAYNLHIGLQWFCSLVLTREMCSERICLARHKLQCIPAMSIEQQNLMRLNKMQWVSSKPVVKHKTSFGCLDLWNPVSALLFFKTVS